jgi:hypothetical protein
MADGSVGWARIRGKAGTEGGDWLSKVALLNWSLRHVVFSFFFFYRIVDRSFSVKKQHEEVHHYKTIATFLSHFEKN